MQPVIPAANERAWPNAAALVALFAAAQIAAWTLTPSLVHSAPPLDVVEGYMWGREWVLATYKHPALPSWFLEASRLLTGAVGWPAYLISQLFIAAAYGFVFLLGRDLMGPERAAAGTLLLAGVTYYSWPTPEFNHNIAAAPLWAGFAWALWRSVERRAVVWWILMAVFAASALYAKLSAALILATAAAWILFDPRARACLATPGPWLSLAVFVLLVAPLAAWLVAHDFAPLKYAAERTTSRSATHIPLFLLDTLANIVGILIILVIAGLIGPWRTLHATNLAHPAAWVIDAPAVRFLLFFTLGPLALAVAAALVSHAGLKTAWGSSMFNLGGLLAVALTADRFTSASLRRIGLSAALLLVALPLGYAATVKMAAHRPTGAGMRVNWPQSAIAERFAGVWSGATDGPLRIVAGDPWLAGLVGLTQKSIPSILTHGDLALSPWITPDRIEREGMLIVWDASTKGIPLRLLPLVAGAKTGEERFNFTYSKDQRDLRIGYAVVPPKPAHLR